jgi:hypothetical protein
MHRKRSPTVREHAICRLLFLLRVTGLGLYGARSSPESQASMATELACRPRAIAKISHAIRETRPRFRPNTLSSTELESSKTAALSAVSWSAPSCCAATGIAVDGSLSEPLKQTYTSDGYDRPSKELKTAADRMQPLSRRGGSRAPRFSLHWIIPHSSRGVRWWLMAGRLPGFRRL